MPGLSSIPEPLEQLRQNYDFWLNLQKQGVTGFPSDALSARPSTKAAAEGQNQQDLTSQQTTINDQQRQDEMPKTASKKGSSAASQDYSFMLQNGELESPQSITTNGYSHPSQVLAADEPNQTSL